METMAVFFKREDEEIKEKTKQKHNSKHPVFPSLNTSSLTHSSLATLHTKCENT